MKQCLLCPELIATSWYQLCYRCYRLYHDYVNEPWYLALIELQRVQDRIDSREQYQLSNTIQIDMCGNLMHTVRDSKRPLGRPSTPRKDIEEVLRLFDQSLENEQLHNGKRLSARGIEKAINKRVKYVTIWKILKKYRSKVFTK